MVNASLKYPSAIFLSIFSTPRFFCASLFRTGSFGLSVEQDSWNAFRRIEYGLQSKQTNASYGIAILIEEDYNQGQMTIRVVKIHRSENWGGQRAGGRANLTKLRRNQPYRFRKLQSLWQNSPSNLPFFAVVVCLGKK